MPDLKPKLQGMLAREDYRGMQSLLRRSLPNSGWITIRTSDGSIARFRRDASFFLSVYADRLVGREEGAEYEYEVRLRVSDMELLLGIGLVRAKALALGAKLEELLGLETLDLDATEFREDK